MFKVTVFSNKFTGEALEEHWWWKGMISYTLLLKSTCWEVNQDLSNACLHQLQV